MIDEGHPFVDRAVHGSRMVTRTIERPERWVRTRSAGEPLEEWLGFQLLTAGKREYRIPVPGGGTFDADGIFRGMIVESKYVGNAKGRIRKPGCEAEG